MLPFFMSKTKSYANSQKSTVIKPDVSHFYCDKVTDKCILLLYTINVKKLQKHLRKDVTK